MVGDEVLMIGHGKDRGAEFSCDGHDGYRWGAGNTMRWGEEEVMLVKPGRWMATEFQPPDGSAAANGDSGGAVFIKVDGEWELTGIIASRGLFNCQWDGARNTSLYGNRAFSVDLATWKPAIEEVIALPEPSQSYQLAVGILAIGMMSLVRRKHASLHP